MIKYVASSYTTRLETEQVLSPDQREGWRGFGGIEEQENLSWKLCTGCLHDLMFTLKSAEVRSLQAVACFARI